MSNKKNSLVTLKKRLRRKSEYELVEEIAHLYKTFPIVKEFYQASYFGEDSKVLQKYKQQVQDEFIPSERRELPRMRISVAKKAVSDYKKVSCSNSGVADIMLTYVEAGLSFSTQFGYSEDPLYSSVLSMFEGALKYVQKEELGEYFSGRIDLILQKSTAEYGWFADELKMIFTEILTAPLSVNIPSNDT